MIEGGTDVTQFDPYRGVVELVIDGAPNIESPISGPIILML